jgi:hypothetical protein
MIDRKEFMNLLDSVEPIPRMIKVHSLGGIVMCVRPLKVSEEKKLASHLKAMTDTAKAYQDAMKDSDLNAAEYAMERMKELSHLVKVQKIAYCLVDEHGNRLVESIDELDAFGVDVIEELTDEIDKAATYKPLRDAIKKK